MISEKMFNKIDEMSDEIREREGLKSNPNFNLTIKRKTVRLKSSRPRGASLSICLTDPFAIPAHRGFLFDCGYTFGLEFNRG